jgi:hypothetical protein
MRFGNSFIATGILALLLSACAQGPDQITAQGEIDGGVGSIFENPLVHLDLIADFSAIGPTTTQVLICTKRAGSLYSAATSGSQYDLMAFNGPNNTATSNFNNGNVSGPNSANITNEPIVVGPIATPLGQPNDSYAMESLRNNLSLAKFSADAGHYLGATILLLPGCAYGIQVKNAYGQFNAPHGQLVVSQMIEVDGGDLGASSEPAKPIHLDMSALWTELSAITSNAQLQAITRK